MSRLPVIYGHSVQCDAQYSAQYEDRPSSLDEACAAAGPGYAVVADRHQLRGVVAYDAERGAPLEDIPPMGWVS